MHVCNVEMLHLRSEKKVPFSGYIFQIIKNFFTHLWFLFYHLKWIILHFIAMIISKEKPLSFKTHKLLMVLIHADVVGKRKSLFKAKIQSLKFLCRLVFSKMFENYHRSFTAEIWVVYFFFQKKKRRKKKIDQRIIIAKNIKMCK